MQLDDDRRIAPAWSAAEARNQIVTTIEQMEREGSTIPANLRAEIDGSNHGLLTRAEAYGAVDAKRNAIDRMYASHVEANAGDEASSAYMQGAAIMMYGGSAETALRHFIRAAELGHVDAMYEAGNLSRDGDDSRAAILWFEAASNAGRSDAAWNRAVLAYELSDLVAAKQWYEKAGNLGDGRGFAALSSMACDLDNDDVLELAWARRGADLGEPWCQARAGLILLRNMESNPSTYRSTVTYLEAASESGDIDSTLLAGIAHQMAGDTHKARMWMLKAVNMGHPRAAEVLNEL